MKSLSELGKKRSVWERGAGVTTSEPLFVVVFPTSVSDAALSQVHHRHFRWVLEWGPEQGRKIVLYSGGSPPGVPLGTTPHTKAK